MKKSSKNKIKLTSKIKRWTKHKTKFNVDALHFAASKTFGYFYRDILIKFKRWGANYEYGLWLQFRGTWQKSHPQVTLALPLNIHCIKYDYENDYHKWDFTIIFLVFELKIEFWDYGARAKSLKWK